MKNLDCIRKQRENIGKIIFFLLLWVNWFVLLSPDEAVFGCSLQDVCSKDKSDVPDFVKYCIGVIESKDEHMNTDGLYRASGNLSQVQKIRMEVSYSLQTTIISWNTVSGAKDRPRIELANQTDISFGAVMYFGDVLSSVELAKKCHIPQKYHLTF